MTTLFDHMGEHAMTPAERKRMFRRSPQPAGYAALPGTGPGGETCGSCKHLVENQLSRSYWKCGLMRRFWTGGAKTDVRKRSPACRNWEREE